MSNATNTTRKFSPSAGHQETTSRSAAQPARSSAIEISDRTLYGGLDMIRGLNDKTKTMFASLRYLSSNSSAHAASISPSSVSQLSNSLIEKVETLIFSIMHSVGPTDTASIGATITCACLGIAGNIYLKLFIQRVSRRDPVYAWQLHLLNESVQLIRSANNPNPNALMVRAENMWPELWLWIYFVSACATVRRCPSQVKTRAWICKELMSARQMLRFDMGDWPKVQGMLGMLVWTEADRGMGLELWTDVCDMIQP